MRRAHRRRVAQFVTWSICSQSLFGFAIGASPFGHALGGGVHSSPEEHHAAPARVAAAPQLDLSLPSASAAPGARAISSESAAPRFSTTLAANDERFAPEPAWHGLEPQLTSTTRIQELVRNERRDGVPLARLWQSKGAALNLGVSPKGKPGLWFVKAVP